MGGFHHRFQATPLATHHSGQSCSPRTLQGENLLGNNMEETLERSPSGGANQTLGLDLILEAARAHGESSEPDHEVGDLQDALRAAWRIMSAGQRAALLMDDAVSEHLELELPDGATSAAERVQSALQWELEAATKRTSFYDQLVSRFPGFLDDSDVNGADLVEWCAENLQRLHHAAHGWSSPSRAFESDEELLDAATHAALDEACRIVQAHLGVEAGDFAGLYFSGDHSIEVKEVLRGYLVAERAQRE